MKGNHPLAPFVDKNYRFWNKIWIAGMIVMTAGTAITSLIGGWFGLPPFWIIVWATGGIVTFIALRKKHNRMKGNIDLYFRVIKHKQNNFI